MPDAARKLLLWGPRVLGILLALFLAMFALDSVDEGGVAVLVHLIPTFVLLAAVGLAWRWEWLGGALFLVLAAVYAAWAWGHPDWILLISGPLVLVGALFLLSWRRRDELHASS